MDYKTHELALPGLEKNFSVKNHVLKSRILKGNALGDETTKHNFVLEPQGAKGPLPLVVHLSGYYGNGPQGFNQKTLEDNFPQILMKLTANKKLAPAVHVFVDAMTGVGGSQFINSDACGNYSDYIQKELVPSLHKEFSLQKDSRYHCVMGASSGGYGALHHVSVKDSVFGVAIALAPDSYFQASLLPDFYKLSPYMSEFSDLKKIKKILAEGAWQKKKNFFPVINAIAMTLCYSKLSGDKLRFPIDAKTGELKEKIWQEFLEKDPVNFIPARQKNLKNKALYLAVGLYDDFHLFFGARRLKDFATHYSEFPGTHYGLNEQKIEALKWLKALWSK